MVVVDLVVVVMGVIWGRGVSKAFSHTDYSISVQRSQETTVNLRLHAYLTLPWHWETGLISPWSSVQIP